MRSDFPALLILLLLLSGCIKGEMSSVGGKETPVPLRATFTVLDDERDLPGCVLRAMRGVDPNVTYVPSSMFRDELFPWFEPDTQPRTAEALSMLLDRALVRERIAHLGVRFVVALSGETKDAKSDGFLLCGHTGCMGLAWWNRQTDLAAIIWNLEKAEKSAKVDVSISGTGVMPAFLIPIPFFPRTKAEACKELGRRIVRKMADTVSK
jgi:hypothetical protein